MREVFADVTRTTCTSMCKLSINVILKCSNIRSEHGSATTADLTDAAIEENHDANHCSSGQSPVRIER